MRKNLDSRSEEYAKCVRKRGAEGTQKNGHKQTLQQCESNARQKKSGASMNSKTLEQWREDFCQESANFISL